MNEFKTEFKHQLDKISNSILNENLLKDLIYTFREAKPHKFNRMLEELYQTKNFARQLDIDIISKDTKGNTPMERMMHVLYKKLKVILKENSICYPKILKRLKVPFGINKSNMGCYVITFFYISMIDSLAEDYEGVLTFLKFVAQCACDVDVEKFSSVNKDLLGALEYKILCRN